MYTLTVKLKQHTPLLHFQPEQYGATLRASEVKPKLDRFLIDKLGGVCKIEKTWLIGDGEHHALNYKMRIEGIGNPVEDIKLRPSHKGNKWGTAPFPSVMSNMGGKEKREELVNFSMYNIVEMTIICREGGLYKQIKDNVALFFARHNFGQRSNKGFGSFTVSRIEDIPQKNQSYFGDMLFMYYKIDPDKDLSKTQKIVMGIIENFWKELKKSIKNDTNVSKGTHNGITTIQQYIRFMKNDSNTRTPSPVLFKPVKYKDTDDGYCYYIYIIPDSPILKRIANESKDKKGIAIADFQNISFIDGFIGYEDAPGSLKNYDYENNEWKTKVDREEISVSFFN